MEFYTRKSAFSELKKYCYLSEPDAFIEITEWKNGEGIDIEVSGKKNISLTYGELELIEILAKLLDKQ